MSYRKLASVQRITALEPIPNADALLVATVLGWKAVVRKDAGYKVGDLVVYFEIDSMIPKSPDFAFLETKGIKTLPDGSLRHRIKTIRLRGQISQGLVMPLTILSSKIVPNEEMDLTEALDIIKYERFIPHHLKGEIEGDFPSFLLKTDEPRVQLLQEVINRHVGTPCYITEKLDGTSITCYVKGEKFGVCSRNLELKRNENNTYWAAVLAADVETKLRSLGRNIAIQGELVGNGLEGNNLKLNDRRIYWFNAFDIDKCMYLPMNEADDIFRTQGLKMVPLLYSNYALTASIEAFVKIATIKSTITPKVWAEGIVVRPMIDILDLGMQAGGFGSTSRVSFKVINPEFLLATDG